jgi:hypothetical protein
MTSCFDFFPKSTGPKWSELKMRTTKRQFSVARPASSPWRRVNSQFLSVTTAIGALLLCGVPARAQTKPSDTIGVIDFFGYQGLDLAKLRTALPVHVGDPVARALQMQERTWALAHEQELVRVLQSSSDAKQRRVASAVLGYAQQSHEQIAVLVGAARDPDSWVRNNATRALAVLVRSNARDHLTLRFPILC